MAGIEVATGELMEMEMPGKEKKQSFEEKYGLQGKGIPIHISEETKDYVKMLMARSDAAMAAGRYYAKHCKIKFK